jgi:endoglucanase
LAKYNHIPYTLEVCSGKTGTNADNILTTGSGIRTGLISVPIKNMHTPVETVKLSDIESVSQIMAEFILSKGDENE